MKYLSHFLLLSLFVQLTQCSEVFEQCGTWSRFKLFWKCRPLFKEYNEFNESQKHTSSKDYGRELEKLKKIDDCLAAFPCAANEKRKFESAIQIASYQETDNKLCLKAFLKKAYQAQFSNEESCYKEYSFLDKEANKRREAYTNGKLCFIKYVRENCTPSTLGYFTHQNYLTFTELISATQYNFNCNGLEVYLNNLRCNTMVDEYNSRIDTFNSIKIRSKNPFVAASIKICKDVVSCKKNSCFSDGNEWERMKLAESCAIFDKEYSS